MNEYTHLAIDFETLDVTPSSIVLSVGLNVFNKIEHSIFKHYNTFDISEQKNRTISTDTLKWWFKQEKTIIEDTILNDTNKIPIDIFLKTFINIVLKYNVRYLWSNGSDFDIPILISLFNSYQIKYPINYQNHRDYRTISYCNKLLKNNKLESPYSIQKHNSLNDVLHISYCIWQFLSTLDG